MADVDPKSSSGENADLKKPGHAGNAGEDSASKPKDNPAPEKPDGGAKREDWRYKLAFLNLNADDATNTPIETEIVGEIPVWLEGSLYRNGPGIFNAGKFAFKHLFDGFSILHRFDLRGGKVTYMSRVLDTDCYQRSVKANRLVISQFGTFTSPDPCKSLFGKMASYFKPMETASTDNTNVNIVEHGDRLYTLTETPWMIRVNPDTLHAHSKENLAKTIAVHLSTAHPHFDREGNMYNLATAFNPPHNYNIVKMPPCKDDDTKVVAGAQRLVSLKSRWQFTIGYNHSFGMSREHFVILEQTLAMSSPGFLTNNWRKAAPYDNFHAYPKEEVLFHVVRRSDNQEVKVKYCSQSAFTFHFINCFEDQGHLVVDFAGYDDCKIMDELMLNNMDKQGGVRANPKFRRYVLPLSPDQKKEKGVNLVTLPDTTATAVRRPDGSIFLTPDYITEQGVRMELPQINYKKVNGEKYRYVYGTTIFSEEPMLVKLDLEQKKKVTWIPEKDYHAGEPVFVANPQGSLEDDGVILSPVLTTVAGQRCYLLVLDASTFTELGRAYAPQGVQMSVSFHGTYVLPKDAHT